MKVSWDRLIRFEATDGRVLHGQPILASKDLDIGTVMEEDNLQAHVIVGDDILGADAKVTDEVVTVKKVLGPLTAKDVPIIKCIGLNYARHIRETGRTLPPFPFFFIKPRTSVCGHNDSVTIPKIAQDNQADYEGEMRCLVIGRDAKDIPKSKAMEYVAAYTVGNDVSSRKLQLDKTFAGPTPQFDFSKGFDSYAPLGPCLVASHLIDDPRKLHLSTKVNGEIRQDEGVSDLIFDCAYLIEHLSQGTTLEKGTVIMTGTPGGVGNGMRPPQFLRSGDVMEVKVSQIGTLRNVVSFA